MDNNLIATVRQHSPLELTSLVFTALMSAVPFFLFQQSGLINTFYVQAAAVAFGLVASVLLIRPIGWRPLYFPAIALVPLGLILLLGLQVGVGLAAYWQLHILAVLYLLWTTLIIVLGAALRHEFGLEKLVPILAWAMLISGVFYSVVVAVNAFKPTIASGLTEGSQPASYLVLALASLIYLVATKRIKNGLSFVMVNFLLCSLALCSYHMVWLYIAVFTVGGWWMAKRKVVNGWYWVCFATLCVVWQWIVLQRGIHDVPLTSGYFANHTGLSSYWLVLQEAWSIFLAHPLLGIGWGQFAWQDFLMADAYPQHTGLLQHPSNHILKLLAEVGIVGACIFVMGVFLWVKNALQDKRATDKKVNIEHGWLWLIFCLLGIDGLFNNAFNDAHMLGLFALILGLYEARIFKVHVRSGHVFSGFCLTFGIIAFVALNTQYHKLQYWYAQDDFKPVAEREIDQMLQQMGGLRHQSLFTPYIDLAIVRTLPNQANLIEDKLNLNSQLIQIKPNAQEIYSQVELLARAGKIEQAKQQLHLALIRHPDYLYTFTMQLLKTQSNESLPLLHMIVRHNRAVLMKEASQLIPKSSGKTPN